jgi:hypothetical protein
LLILAVQQDPVPQDPVAKEGWGFIQEYHVNILPT